MGILILSQYVEPVYTAELLARNVPCFQAMDDLLNCSYDAFIRKYDPNGVVQWTSQTGLSTAFDFPTLMGYDSDHPRSLGEVGREGVAVDTRIIRIFNTYGPRMRQYDGRAIPTFLRQALSAPARLAAEPQPGVGPAREDEDDRGPSRSGDRRRRAGCRRARAPAFWAWCPTK